MARIQATVVAMGGRGVLIHGAPGTGKSDLALRLVDRGALLVADDLVDVDHRDGRLFAAPDPDGRIFVAGIGIVTLPRAPGPVPLALAVLLAGADDLPADRMPLLGRFQVTDGYALPCITLSGLAASAPEKVALALARWGH